MGFQTQTSSGRPAFNFRFSAFLGFLYLSTPANEAAIAEVKATIGEDEVKRGFVGTSPDSASGKAIAMLKERGVSSVKLYGELTGANIVVKEVNGNDVPYLRVRMDDADGRYFVSVDLSQPSAQMLARKLVNAEFGAQTSLSMFATYEQKEGKDKAYAEHGASLKQGADAGVEVKGISPVDTLKPLKEATIANLDKIGMKDKNVRNASISSVEVTYHRELVDGLKPKVDAYWAARGQKADAPAETAE
jgi:hypothetical protein